MFRIGTRILGMARYGVVWVGKMVGFSIKFLVISNIRKVLHQFCVDVAPLDAALYYALLT
jgi:ABC-type transport system involved in cytochrome bd biosynthesis fused ATPase/permease subunit